MQEYYIRKEGDEDSRGPFTLEQLSSLVEAGQVDRQTFYYDAISEKWIEVQANSELVAALFPVKKKLSIRSKEAVPAINVVPEGEREKPITVEDMLAAAEGQTDETRGKRDLTDVEATAALWGMRLLSIILLLSAAGMLVSNMETISTGDFLSIVSSPLIILGLVDVVLALLLFLEVSAIYGLVRTRAAIGAGFFLLYFGSVGDWLSLVAVLAGSVALFATTYLVKLWKVITMGLVGLAGMAGFAYLMLN